METIGLRVAVLREGRYSEQTSPETREVKTMKRKGTFRCPEDFALLEMRRETDSGIRSEYSCIDRGSALSDIASCASHGEVSKLQCRVYECPSGYVALGPHTRDEETGREVFEFSCVSPEGRQSVSLPLSGLV
jgi:hypothetical protein